MFTNLHFFQKKLTPNTEVIIKYQCKNIKDQTLNFKFFKNCSSEHHKNSQNSSTPVTNVICRKKNENKMNLLNGLKFDNTEEKKILVENYNKILRTDRNY